MKINELTHFLNRYAPLSLQETYDNAGLIVGNSENDISSVLITLDVTESVVEEAVLKKANVILAHHPVIFRAIKQLTGKTDAERAIIKAIKNDIAIYALHTNVDNIDEGVNKKISEKIGLQYCRILSPMPGRLRKLITFVPEAQAEKVRKALSDAGAGVIGKYDSCSFNVAGYGTFRAGFDANPFVGKIGEIHREAEIRTETVYPDYLENTVLKALYACHPYEEPAFDIVRLENTFAQAGAGMIGTLPKPISESEFLNSLKNIFHLEIIKHTRFLDKPIQRVALCGGSGSFLLKTAISEKADVFISGDFKYHEFFDAENKILIADIGHFESEQFTKDLFYDVLTKKFPTFACFLSEINTNPIKYF